MNNKKRGEFLRKARENKNLTQEELGSLIFYSDKTISAWEKGIYTPSNYETIIKLSEVLEISPLSILYGENNVTEEKQVSSYFEIKKQFKLKILLLTLLFLLSLLIILISYYYTNLKDNIFKDSTIKKNDNKSILIELGFEYIDGLNKYKKDNITITYNPIGDLTLIKENKNNNEYFSKRIKNNNIFYKKITKEGKYVEKELLIKEKKVCNLQDKKEINDLAKCLNYLAWKLNNEEL